MQRRLFLSAGFLLGTPLLAQHKQLVLNSQSYVVMDANSGILIAQHNATQNRSIASITKLMTGMVVLDAAHHYKNKIIQIEKDDIDTLKGSSSRLAIGSRWPTSVLLHVTLMSSDNRAAHALARLYPGGTNAFIITMNKKASQLELKSTTFVDSSGLNPRNKSKAHEVAIMTSHSGQYADLRFYSTSTSLAFKPQLGFNNTNTIVRQGHWPLILISKTGFIRESGRCVTMLAQIKNKQVVVTLLNAASIKRRTTDLEITYNWLMQLQSMD